MSASPLLVSRLLLYPLGAQSHAESYMRLASPRDCKEHARFGCEEIARGVLPKGIDAISTHPLACGFSRGNESCKKYGESRIIINPIKDRYLPVSTLGFPIMLHPITTATHDAPSQSFSELGHHLPLSLPPQRPTLLHQ